MITHITVEDAAKLISRIAGANETQALTYIREAADRGEIQGADALKKLQAELEKVKVERDAAIKTIFQWTGCPECKWWDSADEWCEKHDRSADSCGGCCSPEWRGQKEE